MGFVILGNKTFDFSCKKKDFLPKNDQIWPKTGIFGQFGPGHAGLFSALLVGQLVVVAHGLYLARHLFTLLIVTADINTIIIVLVIIITIYLKSSAPVSWTSNMLWERPIRLRRVWLLSQMCQGLHRSPWNQSQIVFIFDWLFREVSSLRHIEINFRPSCKLAEEPLTSPEDAPMVCSALKLVVSIHNKQLPPPNKHHNQSAMPFTSPPKS